MRRRGAEARLGERERERRLDGADLVLDRPAGGGQGHAGDERADVLGARSRRGRAARSRSASRAGATFAAAAGVRRRAPSSSMRIVRAASASSRESGSAASGTSDAAPPGHDAPASTSVFTRPIVPV